MNNDGLVYHKQINSYLKKIILFDRLFFSFVKTISAHIFDNPSFIVLQIYKNIFKKKMQWHNAVEGIKVLFPQLFLVLLF